MSIIDTRQNKAECMKLQLLRESRDQKNHRNHSPNSGNFSKVGSVVVVYIKLIGKLTFENFWQMELKKEELRRLKNVKKNEILERLKTIQQISGVLQFVLQYVLQSVLQCMLQCVLQHVLQCVLQCVL